MSLEHHSISPLVDLLDKTIEHVFHDALHVLIRALRFGGIIGGKHMAGRRWQTLRPPYAPGVEHDIPFCWHTGFYAVIIPPRQFLE